MNGDSRIIKLRAILIEDWDPVGFGTLLPTDEYDRYIPAIIDMLNNNCTLEDLEAHLVLTEKTWFDVEPPTGNARQAAKSLLNIWNSAHK